MCKGLCVRGSEKKNIYDINWISAVVYRGTNETTDICFEQWPEELARPTSAGTQTSIHSDKHACTQLQTATSALPPWGYCRTENCQEKSESTFPSSHGNSRVSLLSFKCVKSFTLKTQLMHLVFYSHQSLCLLFISVLLMLIFIARSKTAMGVFFSASKVNQKAFSTFQNMSNTCWDYKPKEKCVLKSSYMISSRTRK